MITKSDPGIWCDYCKLLWGKAKGTWHPKATTPATVTVHSTNPKSNVTKRHYCNECALEVTTFSATTTTPAYRWGLSDQLTTMEITQLEIGA